MFYVLGKPPEEGFKVEKKEIQNGRESEGGFF